MGTCVDVLKSHKDTPSFVVCEAKYFPAVSEQQSKSTSAPPPSLIRMLL